MRPTLPLFLLTALATTPAAGAAWRDDPAPSRSALAALLERARASMGRVPFDSSRVLLHQVERAAEPLADSAALVEARVALAFLDSRQVSLPAALAGFAAAERALPAGDARTRARVRCWRAPVLTFAGRPGAVEEITAGLHDARLADDAVLLGLCYQSAVTVLSALGTEGALIEAYADSAATTQARAGDRFGWSVTEFVRGFSRLQRTDLAGARRALLLARREARASGNTFSEGWIHRFLGETYWWAGDFLAADLAFARAESVLTWMGDRFGLGGLSYVRTGLLIDLGRLDEAQARLEADRDAADRDPNGDSYGVRYRLAEVTLRRGRWAEASAELEAALRYAHARGQDPHPPGLAYTRGLLDLRLGRLGPAMQAFRGILADPESAELDRYVARARLAEALVARGDLDGALAEMRAANAELERLRARLDDPELRRLVYQTRQTFDEPDLGLATIVGALARVGRAADALRLAEERRARTLRDRRTAARSFEPSAASGRADTATAWATPDTATAFLEYVTGWWGAPTTLFVVTSEGVRSFVLPPLEALRAPLGRYVDLLRTGDSATAPGRSLGAALLAPAIAALPDRVTRLVLVPDDALHYVPFEALPLPDGTPLGARFALSQVPSLAVAGGAPGAHDPAPRVLALGDPAYGPPAADDPLRLAYEASGGLPALPGARREARIAASFGSGSVARTGAAASEAFLKSSSLVDFGVLHFATHALVDARSLASSSLALAPGGGEDGFLTAGEIGALALEGKVVLLSGCRTATGAVVGGEGILGLTTALLEAGTRAVVASRWPVRDRAAADLIAALYAGMAEGLPLDAALQRAQAAQRRRGVPAADWAAYVVVGDGSVRLPLRRPIPWWSLWAGALALLGAGAWWAARRRLSAARE